MKEKGFVSAASGTVESVKFGIVASTQHPQVNYSAVNYSKAPWAAEPAQTINYVSCHDDNTLFDRLQIANPEAVEADLIKMDKLSQMIVFTSQGVPFIQSGAELLRTKKGIANSYNSPDSINEIEWSRKAKYKNLFEYYTALIALRKHHPAFRMPTTKLIQQRLRFINTELPLSVAYRLDDHANGDKWKDILVLLNGNKTDKTFFLPPGNWTLSVDGNTVNEQGLKQFVSAVSVPGTTGFVLFKLE